jgi:hypothetical protein
MTNLKYAFNQLLDQKNKKKNFLLVILKLFLVCFLKCRFSFLYPTNLFDMKRGIKKIKTK